MESSWTKCQGDLGWTLKAVDRQTLAKPARVLKSLAISEFHSVVYDVHEDTHTFLFCLCKVVHTSNIRVMMHFTRKAPHLSHSLPRLTQLSSFTLYNLSIHHLVSQCYMMQQSLYPCLFLCSPFYLSSLKLFKFLICFSRSLSSSLQAWGAASGSDAHPGSSVPAGPWVPSLPSAGGPPVTGNTRTYSN